MVYIGVCVGVFLFAILHKSVIGKNKKRELFTGHNQSRRSFRLPLAIHIKRQSAYHLLDSRKMNENQLGIHVHTYTLTHRKTIEYAVWHDS